MVQHICPQQGASIIICSSCSAVHRGSAPALKCSCCSSIFFFSSLQQNAKKYTQVGLMPGSKKNKTRRKKKTNSLAMRSRRPFFLVFLYCREKKNSNYINTLLQSCSRIINLINPEVVKRVVHPKLKFHSFAIHLFADAGSGDLF